MLIPPGADEGHEQRSPGQFLLVAAVDGRLDELGHTLNLLVRLLVAGVAAATRERLLPQVSESDQDPREGGEGEDERDPLTGNEANGVEAGPPVLRELGCGVSWALDNVVGFDEPAQEGLGGVHDRPVPVGVGDSPVGLGLWPVQVHSESLIIIAPTCNRGCATSLRLWKLEGELHPGEVFEGVPREPIAGYDPGARWRVRVVDRRLNCMTVPSAVTVAATSALRIRVNMTSSASIRLGGSTQRIAVK